MVIFIEIINLFVSHQESSWEEFGRKTAENYSENQKLSFSILTQLKQKKQPKLSNTKDKEENM